VQEVTTGLKSLTSYTPDTYSFPGEFGDLPHALLRRTGGLENEAWANTEFELSRDELGWPTLEFLAWWVRDRSRSGEQIQLRPMALPPKVYEVQLGGTLKFIFDHFVICDGDGNDAALRMMQERADWLDMSINLYAEVLGELARPREGKLHSVRYVLFLQPPASSTSESGTRRPKVCPLPTQGSWLRYSGTRCARQETFSC
jgi:hypothetical protein